VNNFVFLAQQGFFNGITFHRVLPSFMAQTGDPTGTGMGGPGYNVPLEIHPALKYDKAGVIGVARSQNKDSAGSQFFITFEPVPALDPFSKEIPDNEGYTIIGQVVEGMDAVLGIRLRDPDHAPNYPGDTLVSVVVIDLTTNPKK
jgi:cyclophilin family peptidyl-prolyl cis-trans isomerase